MTKYKDEEINCDVYRGDQNPNDKIILIIDHRDRSSQDFKKDFDQWDEEKKMMYDKLKEYNINNFLIYFTDTNSDLTKIMDRIKEIKPIIVVPMGFSFNLLCPGLSKKPNSIHEHPDFFYEEEGITYSIPIFYVYSAWTVKRNPDYPAKAVILKEGMEILSRGYDIRLDYVNNIFPKIILLKKELKIEKESTKNQSRIFEINRELDEIERNYTITNYRNQVFGKKDIDAESEIILSYDKFKEFCNKEIDPYNDVAYDVETNALEVMDINHEIIGFSLATGASTGCYVPLKSIDFMMPERDRELIEGDLKNILETKKIWVYNCQHEIPVVYNHYNIFLKDVKDLYVIVKLLNCGKKWGDGNRSLKHQVEDKLGKSDWSADLTTYFSYFKKLNKPEFEVKMKTLLSKYYSDEELNGILEKVIERYNILKDTPSMSEKEVLSYEHVPYKLIGRYGSLDSSSLFLLNEYYEAEMDEKNEIHNKDKKPGERIFDLHEGYNLWQKIHIAHVIMEMNGFYFNDKKAEKLNKWINEKVINIMDYFVRSDLVKDWIKYKSFLYDFSHDILMMDYVDDIIDNEQEAKVLPSKNAITKEHIKFYKPTKMFYKNIKDINDKILYPYNLCSEAEVNMTNRSLIEEYLSNCNVELDNGGYIVNYIINLNKIYQTKPARYITTEFTAKDGFIIKLDWQHLFILFLFFNTNIKNNIEILENEYDKWLKNKLDNVNTFEDYKELFNVNSTTKDFRNYISDILLNNDIKLGHTYYKLYELYESADFEDLLEDLENPKKSYKTEIHDRQLDLLLDFKNLIEKNNNLEVFSSERLELFKTLYNKHEYYYDKRENCNRNLYKSDFIKKALKECFEWVRDDEYKLQSLDSGTMEELTQLYGMTGCNIDEEDTWTESFRFMFNYKFIKKLLKAKTTYINGSTSRASARYIDKYYYKKGELFPRRLKKYSDNSDINKIYDVDKAIQIELENGIIKTFDPKEEIQLSDGTIKLAKDLQENDDIILEEFMNDIEDDSEIDENENDFVEVD